MPADTARVALIVEDDLSVRQPLVKFLEMNGYRTVTTDSADEAREILASQRIDAAIVDLRLKVGSGRDVVLSTPADIPVIIFSGLPSESAELERFRPRTRLVAKPYSLVMLVEMLGEMLAGKGSQDLHP